MLFKWVLKVCFKKELIIFLRCPKFVLKTAVIRDKRYWRLFKMGKLLIFKFFLKNPILKRGKSSIQNENR